VALGDRIAAPLGERREAFRLRAQESEFRLRDPPLAHLASSSASWLTWASQVLLRTAVRVGNPFPAAPGKFTVAIFLDERPPACQHLAHRDM
jgi:hypothetical protein